MDHSGKQILERSAPGAASESESTPRGVAQVSPHGATPVSPDGAALVSPHGAAKQAEATDPMDLVGTMVPGGDIELLARCFVEEFAAMGYVFGFDIDNHAVNTVPKETLIKITKAEPGGIGGTGVWAPARTGLTPGHENSLFDAYLGGDLTKVEKGQG